MNEKILIFCNAHTHTHKNFWCVFVRIKSKKKSWHICTLCIIMDNGVLCLCKSSENRFFWLLKGTLKWCKATCSVCVYSCKKGIYIIMAYKIHVARCHRSFNTHTHTHTRCSNVLSLFLNIIVWHSPITVYYPHVCNY